MFRFLLLHGAVLLLSIGSLQAGESGESVVVVYNSRVAESKGVADHYAKQRIVPASQILGLDLPTGETMTREQFRGDLQRPLLKWLEDNRFFTFRLEPDPKLPGAGTHWKVVEARVRYLVLCYGVPLRIAPDASIREEGIENIPEPLRRNGAAVESELSVLPLQDFKLPLTGPLRNPGYGATNVASLHPTNGIFLVTRLDGPTPDIAKGLVDKAVEAEKTGWWGRAYFDLRGITNADYKVGDDWLRTAADVTRRFGFDTTIEETPATFTAAFPMSQIGWYAGWYDPAVSGPFTRSAVEFMPGAFAYHLHSFSAQTIRSSTANWVGPLLAKGATITFGAVDEPYLLGTPDIGTFAIRFMPLGMTFAEAAYASLSLLSWQIAVVGDPLYRPFGLPPLQRHQELEGQKNKLREWSHLKALNINSVNGTPIAQLITHLENEPFTKTSAVLSEKLGLLYDEQGKPTASLKAFREALAADPTPQQRLRIVLFLADKLAPAEPGEAARVLRDLVAKFPDYPDRKVIEDRIEALERKPKA